MAVEEAVIGGMVGRMALVRYGGALWRNDEMRTLFQIVDGAKDGNRPTEDECYYAMLALSSIVNVIMIQDDKAIRRKVFQEALRRSPQGWLGELVPENPEYQKDRQRLKWLWNMAMGGKPWYV